MPQAPPRDILRLQQTAKTEWLLTINQERLYWVSSQIKCGLVFGLTQMMVNFTAAVKQD